MGFTLSDHFHPGSIHASAALPVARCTMAPRPFGNSRVSSGVSKLLTAPANVSLLRSGLRSEHLAGGACQFMPSAHEAAAETDNARSRTDIGLLVVVANRAGGGGHPRMRPSGWGGRCLLHPRAPSARRSRITH